jgi:hypothetical protein
MLAVYFAELTSAAWVCRRVARKGSLSYLREDSIRQLVQLAARTVSSLPRTPEFVAVIPPLVMQQYLAWQVWQEQTQERELALVEQSVMATVSCLSA